MREYTLNMLSHADQVKGQGVLSAYEEELAPAGWTAWKGMGTTTASGSGSTPGRWGMSPTSTRSIRSFSCSCH